jgi:hypothetical protein
MVVSGGGKEPWLHTMQKGEIGFTDGVIRHDENYNSALLFLVKHLQTCRLNQFLALLKTDQLKPTALKMLPGK